MNDDTRIVRHNDRKKEILQSGTSIGMSLVFLSLEKRFFIYLIAVLCHFLFPFVCIDGSAGKKAKVPSSNGKRTVNYKTVNHRLCNEFGKKVV